MCRTLCAGALLVLVCVAGCSSGGGGGGGECVAGGACAPADPCHLGAIDCSSGSAACVDTGVAVTDGTGCGAGAVCQGGICVATTLPRIEQLAASPSNIPPGGTSTLSWAVSPGATLRVEPGVGAVAGTSVIVSPESSTTYTLRATNAFGSASASVTVMVSRIGTVSVGDATVPAGRSVPLTSVVTVLSGSPDLRVDWSVEGGDLSGTLDPSRGTTTLFAAPETPGSYVVWAASVWEPARRGSATVTVTPPPDSWRTLAPMSVPRAGLAAVAVGGKVYAIGGRRWSDGQYPTTVTGVLGTVEEYDPATDRWTTRAPMPTPRAYFSAVASRGLIYCIGGLGAGGTRLDAVEAFDPATDTWKTLSPAPALYGAAAVTLGEQVYLFEGDGDGLYVDAYDVGADAWYGISGWYPEKQAGPTVYSAVEASGLLVRTPGVRWLDGPASDFLRWISYDPARAAWSHLWPMGAPRTLFGVAGLEGRIYAIGGERAYDPRVGTATVEEYSVSLDVWVPRAPLPFERRQLSVAVLDGRIVALGGYTCVPPGSNSWCFPVEEAQEYTPPSDPSGPDPLSVEVGSHPFAALHDGTSIWVANTGSGTVSRIRPDDGKLLATVTVGAEPKGNLAFDGTSLWVTNTAEGSVSRIDIADAAVTTYQVPGGPHGVAFDGTYAWIANFDAGSVTRLFPPDASFNTSYGIGARPNGVVIDPWGNPWVSRPGEIAKLSPADGTRLASYAGAFDPYGLTFDGNDGVWFADYAGNTVTRLSVYDATPEATYVVGSNPISIACVGSTMWVANAGSGTVTRLRSTDGTILSTTPVPGTPYGVAFDGRAVWLTDHAGQTVTRFR